MFKLVIFYKLLKSSNCIIGIGYNFLKADIDKLKQEGPIDDEDLIEIMTINENKDVDIDEEEDEVQVLMANLVREGLKFATSLEPHFLDHDPDMERVLKLQRKLKSCVAGYQQLSKQLKKPIEAANNEDNSALEQNPTVVLDIFSDDSANFSSQSIINVHDFYQIAMSSCNAVT